MFEIIYEADDGQLHATAVEGSVSRDDAVREVRASHHDLVAIVRVEERRVAA